MNKTKIAGSVLALTLAAAAFAAPQTTPTQPAASPPTSAPPPTTSPTTTAPTGTPTTPATPTARTAQPVTQETRGTATGRPFPAFNDLDKNNDHMLAKEEVSAEATLSADFAKFDTNGDGKLSEPEYARFKNQMARSKSDAMPPDRQ